MGVRQHVAELESRGLVSKTAETKQTRGRPVRLWRLTGLGHQQFPDGHGDNTAQLLEIIRQEQGASGLKSLIVTQHQSIEARYRAELEDAGPNLEDRLRRLAHLRSADGYMAEIRLLPNAWMLIENHCPIMKAAKACNQYCASELSLFQSLLGEQCSVSRVDHALDGARRCAYKIYMR